MKSIAIYSLKGGVGKTTTCTNLAYCAAQQNRVSLIWDLDPQGAATFYYQLKPKIKGGIERMLGKKGHLGNFIKETQYADLDVLPADLSYRQLELFLDEMKKSKKKLRRSLQALASEYEYVFLDCPPSLGTLARHIFEMSDYVLFPLVPTTLSERAFQQVYKYFKQEKLDAGRLIPFFSRVDRRKKLHLETIHAFSQKYPQTLATHIPNSAIVERMGIQQAPVSTYARRSAPAQAFHLLWQEVDSLP
ncbi:MAG: AAA family ATPase [Bacteroidota bacterium]